MLPTITQLVKGEPEFDSHVSDSEAFWTSMLSCFPSGTGGSWLSERSPKRSKGPAPQCNRGGSMATLGSENGSSLSLISLSRSQTIEQMEALRKWNGEEVGHGRKKA